MSPLQSTDSQFKRAQASDSSVLSECIYESSHELMDFMFTSRSEAIPTLTKQVLQPRGLFSYRFGYVYYHDNHIKGAVVGYTKQHMQQQELIGAIQLLIDTPLKLKWHLLTTVRKALNNYVPLPSEDAFYINNIAVFDEYRGQGIGADILDSLCNWLQKQNISSIELDVTQCNKGAINFYQRYGFHIISQSGSDELEQQFQLPILLRMRYFIPTSNLAKSSPRYTNIIKEVSRLYPIAVDDIYVPGTVEQLQDMLKNTQKPISIGGGRYSMGGQIAHSGSLHIDMRGLNRILDLNVEQQTITVQAGTRWRDIQACIQHHGLAIKIMQTYANFTIGGSLSVNCHGRYVSLGPLILSINSIVLILHNGKRINASPATNSELFYAAIGGYGAVGIVVEAELSLTTDCHIERLHKKMPLSDYPAFFKHQINNNTKAIFHNADILPPRFDKIHAVTWSQTTKPVNVSPHKERKLYLLEKYMLWTITESPWGHWRREYIYEPLMYWNKKITTRNEEANYNVAELEPISRNQNTYVLQEYFIPVDRIDDFTPIMTEILNRYHVKAVNVSIRHSHADPGSLLAWAREEVFAFVLYYKQQASDAEQQKVAIWTRELIEAAINAGGCYYLPYQPHARYDQFHRAYPNAAALFALKDKWDPHYRFRHCLWEKYYRQTDDIAIFSRAECGQSAFRQVFSTINGRDDFYLFLQNIYHLYPEHLFHALISQCCQRFTTDKDIYHETQYGLRDIKPKLADITYALPALAKQKKEMACQTSTILATTETLKGYLEIGSTGRYVKTLQKQLSISGPIFLCNDIVPDNSPAEIAERGSIKPVGHFFDLANYEPLPAETIANASLDLVSCYIGLHHCPPHKLDAFIASIARVLKPGGRFILRDHNAENIPMQTFCALVHTVFNAGLGVSWAENKTELRNFQGLDYWITALAKHNLINSQQYLLQQHDPSLNTLMRFDKKI
ncbi:FAD-binding oxidoreductase [Photobacterium aquimaris]|uniref:GNAT family N-acetyltransferase n=1 Tax=Photobacterium aquimaris TaxID=512643 RepID=UPI0007EFD0B6|nr:GNAT family N-acetyltransferase [Photobacterium aquimaris]OBU16906.1 FAD-binding oxidoreductase [Photobacterium aquimaris]PSW00005.1 FAD-binding protein [Photobacterium aquimaris]